jgi:hypothetical protein
MWARLDFHLTHETRTGGIRLLLDEPRGRFKVPCQEFDLRFHGLLSRPREVLVDGRPLLTGREGGEEAVRGLVPGHNQARLRVPFGTREVLLEGVQGIAGAK